MFAADPGGNDSGLRVRVVWYGLLNQVLGISDFATWPRRALVAFLEDRLERRAPGTASTRARLDVRAHRDHAARRRQPVVDDLYIDPWVNRIG
jgi:hypothetical protein